MKQDITNMYLRPFVPEDAPRILSWCRDKHAFRLWSADRFKDYPATPAELVKQFEGGNIFPLVAVVGEEVVGHLMLRYPTDDLSVVRFGFVIVDDAKREMGYGKQMLMLALEYAKQELGAKRITLGVFHDNTPALECYKSVDFHVTGSEDYVIDGEKWSCIEMEMKMKNETQQMETERIKLRPWCEGDAESLYKYASDPDVGPRAGWPPHKSIEESLEIICTLFNNETTWAIELKETGEAIGAIGYGPSCDCNLPAREGEPIVGYWIAKPYWNQGICTEALSLMLGHIRQTTGIPSLISGHFVDNPASGRVMEKCGFVPTGETCIDENQYQGKDRPIRVLRLELA